MGYLFVMSKSTRARKEKTYPVRLTADQIKAVSTQFSMMAGVVQYKAVKCPKRQVAQFTREWELYRGIAKKASAAIGYESWMVEADLHPGPAQD